MANSTIQQASSSTKETIIMIYSKDGARLLIIRDNLKEAKKKAGGYGKI
jgi:hypothetical protein